MRGFSNRAAETISTAKWNVFAPSAIKWLGALVIVLVLCSCSPLNSWTNALKGQPGQPASDNRSPELTSFTSAPEVALPISAGGSGRRSSLVPINLSGSTHSADIVPEKSVDTSTADETPVLKAFIDQVKNGKSSQVVGVYVNNVLALPVVQQPENAPEYVSIRDNEATQFGLALTNTGNIGLLAHNHLSGRLFFNLVEGDVVQIVLGDGSTQLYQVKRIESYQALNPDSTTSQFLDLASGETLSSTSLFYKVYGGNRHITFQTCIAKDGKGEWGRLFIIADPIN